MSNTDIAIRHDYAVSPWRAFADENLASAMVGDLITFAKGKWRRGEGKEPVPEGARFLCNMEEIWTGWIRWFDGKAVEHRIGRLIDFPPRLSREDLGHLDESKWETDPSGNLRDPWAQTDRMVMRDENGELCTFSTSSVGGRHAISKLCKSFDTGSSKHDGYWPVVVLEVETYQHHVYGEIMKPRFKIVDWQPWDEAQAQKEPKPSVDDLSMEIPF